MKNFINLIFKFRGISKENFLSFKKIFKTRLPKFSVSKIKSGKQSPSKSKNEEKCGDGNSNSPKNKGENRFEDEEEMLFSKKYGLKKRSILKSKFLSKANGAKFEVKFKIPSDFKEESINST